MSARELLTQLLDYIEEQAKDVNPSAYRLASSKGFLKRRADLEKFEENDLHVIHDTAPHRGFSVVRSSPEPAHRPSVLFGQASTS